MQKANLVLKDNADVDVTLTPVQTIGLLLTYSNLAKATVNLREKVTLGLRPSKGTVVAKTQLRITIPYEEELSDGVVVTQYVQFNLDATVPPNAPVTSIEDGISMMSTALANGQVSDTIKMEAFPY